MAGLLAGLDALVVGSLALVLILAGTLFLRPLLVGVLSNAPFIGGWLASNVDSGLAGYQRWLQSTAGPWVRPVADALHWLAWVAQSLPASLLGVAEAAVAAIWNLRHLDLPALEARAASFVSASVAELHRLLLGAIAAAESAALAAVDGARSLAAGLFATAEADALTLAQAERVAATDLVEVARTEAASLFQQAEAAAVAGVQEAENLAQELVREERAAMLAAVGIVEHDLQALAAAERVVLADSIAAVGGDVTAAAAQAKQDLTVAEAQLQHSIDGILNSMPWQSLAAGVAASEEMLKAEVRTLVIAGAHAIREEIGNAEAIRLKYGPAVRAALADLKSRT